MVDSWAKNLDIAKAYKEGTQARHEPQRLMNERQKEMLENELAQAINPHKINQAKLSAEQTAIQNKYMPREKESEIAGRQANTRHTNIQSDWLPEMNRSHILHQNEMTKQAQGFKSDFGRALEDAKKINAQYGDESPEGQLASAFVKRMANEYQNKNLTPLQATNNQLKANHAALNDPNISNEQKQEIQMETNAIETERVRKAVGDKQFGALQSAIPMQESIRMLTSEDSRGLTPLDYLTGYSGIKAKIGNVAAVAMGSDFYKKKEQAEGLLHIFEDQYRTFVKGSVQKHASMGRKHAFNPSSLRLNPKEASAVAKNTFKAITKEHQVSLDESRKKAGLPALPYDVNGIKREIPREYKGFNGEDGASKISESEKKAISLNKPKVMKKVDGQWVEI